MVNLLGLLQSTGLPVAYHHFEEPPNPPYIVYLTDGSNNFSADNKVYAKFNTYRVELYTTKKDIISETKVEDVLDSAEMFYESYEVYIKSEELYQVVYEIEI